jgi:tRNA-intron endonuclease
MNKIRANLIGNEIFSNDSEAYSLNSAKDFGKRDQDKIAYMFVEALFLVENGRMELFDKKEKLIPLKKLIRLLIKIDKRIQIRYSAYKDLRSSGYIPKTALKYGADFRVYKSRKSHSKWLCLVSSEKESFSWQEFASKNRVAHSTKKPLLIAIVDEEKDITYYEVNWMKV